MLIRRGLTVLATGWELCCNVILRVDISVPKSFILTGGSCTLRRKYVNVMEPLLCIMKISDGSNEGERIDEDQESSQFNVEAQWPHG